MESTVLIAANNQNTLAKARQQLSSSARAFAKFHSGSFFAQIETDKSLLYYRRTWITLFFYE